MSSNAESASAAARSRLRRAEHAGRAYDADIAACRMIAAPDGALRYISHITSGIFDFAIEIPGDRRHGDETWGVFGRAGRQLNLAAVQLDATCKRLDSGGLIRVVIQGNSGALFQCLKRPGQTFFGLTLDPAAEIVDQADRQLVELSESAAHRIGAESLNWARRRSAAAPGEPRPGPAPGPSTGATVPPYVFSGEPSVPDAVARLCTAALDLSHLHYLGIYRGGRVAWYADIFDDPKLAPLFQRVTPEFRRRAYTRLIRQVQLQSRRFGQLLNVVHSDRLTRLVLDVARGATYVLPLTEDDLLVGVTLDHARVERADRQIQALHEKIRGGWATASGPSVADSGGE